LISQITGSSIEHELKDVEKVGQGISSTGAFGDSFVYISP